MALVLNPKLALAKQVKTIVLHETPLVGDAWFIETISSADAILLSLFDGVRTVSDILDSIGTHSWSALSVPATQSRIDYFRERGVLIDSAEVLPDQRPRTYDPSTFAFAAEVRSRRSRLELPVGMTYVCTRRCNLACRYCYAAATPNITEELLPVGRLYEIIDEAASLGMTGMNISGGEPFRHPRIFAVLERIIRNGMYPWISTKAPLGERAVRRLSEIGLRSIQVSLDSGNRKISDYLVGRVGHHEGVIKTIRLLVQYGIEVLVNAVATPYNVRTLPDLARLLDGWGAAKFCVAPYGPSLGRCQSDLTLTEDEIEWLRRTLAYVADECLHLKVSSPVMRPERRDKSEGLSKRMPDIGMYCSAGIHGFVLLPDGRVTICERLVHGQELVVGDLRSQSIFDMWQSPAWEKIWAPDRNLYQGTACYSCADFVSCTERRLRCFVNSIRAYGRFFGPEPSCPRLPDFGLQSTSSHVGGQVATG